MRREARPGCSRCARRAWRCDAIGELHVRSSRLTCARRMSSNSSRKQHSQCLAAATVTRWYSCRAAAAVKCRQAWTMSPFYKACVRATGPSGSQRRSKGDDRVARGRGVREGVCEDSTEQPKWKKGERMEATVVWQAVVVGRSVFFTATDRARQGVVVVW